MFRPELAGIHSDGVARHDLQRNHVLRSRSTFGVFQASLEEAPIQDFPRLYVRKTSRIDVQRSIEGDKKRLHKFKLGIEDPPRRKELGFLGCIRSWIMAERAKATWTRKSTKIYMRRSNETIENSELEKMKKRTMVFVVLVNNNLVAHLQSSSCFLGDGAHHKTILSYYHTCILKISKILK